jgi:molecular chaperone GrpE
LDEDAAEDVEKTGADPLTAVELPLEHAATGAEGGAAEAFQKRAQLAEDRLAEVLAAYRTLKTENEGHRERITRNLERRFDQRRERLLLKFIDILDNLDRALEATEQTYTGTPMIEGIILVRSQLLSVLQEEGLERIPVLGLPYDPNVAEAVETRPVAEPEHHHVVVKEQLRGYRLNGRVARAARVVVGEHTGDAAVVPAADPEALVGSDEVAAHEAAEAEDDGPSVDALAAAAAESVLPGIDPASLVEDAHDTQPAPAVLELTADELPEAEIAEAELVEAELAEPELPELAELDASSAGLQPEDLVDTHLPPGTEPLDAESELDELLASPVRLESALREPAGAPAEEIDLLKEVLGDDQEPAAAPPQSALRKPTLR